MSKTILFSIGIIVMAVGLFSTGCGHSSANQEFQSAIEKINQIEKVAVKTTPVVTGTIISSIKPIGTLSPITRTAVAAETEGKIIAFLPSIRKVESVSDGQLVSKTLSIDIGSQVRKGDLLFEIDPTDYEIALEQAEAALALVKAQKDDLLTRGRRPEELAQLEAGIEQSAAQVNQAKSEFERIQKLVPSKAESESALENVEKIFKVAEATKTIAERSYELALQGPSDQQIAVADAQILAAEKQVKMSREKLAKTKICAEYDAIVTRRFVDVGNFVKVGDKIIEYIDSQILFADITIPENVAGEIRPTTDADLTDPMKLVKIFITGFKEPVTGVIDHVNDMIDPDTFSKRIRISVPNYDGHLTAGGFIRAEIPVQSRENVLIIPRDAILLVNGHYLAYVYYNGKVEQRSLKVGLSNDTQMEVQNGLSASEEIVCEKLSVLSDGMEVARIETSVAMNNEK